MEHRALRTAVPQLPSLSAWWVVLATAAGEHRRESAPSDAARGSDEAVCSYCGNRANLTGDAALRADRDPRPPAVLVLLLETAQPPPPGCWSACGRLAGADANACAAPSLTDRLLHSSACRCRDLRRPQPNYSVRIK